jgi:hypothetical protein
MITPSPDYFQQENAFLQGAGGSAAAHGKSSAMMITIQQSPEWLRHLLLILPVSRPPSIDETVSADERKRNGEVKMKATEARKIKIQPPEIHFA